MPEQMIFDQTISMRYLQSELARIDVLIHREVRRWQLTGQNMDDNFRGLYVSDTDADALLQRPFSSSWGQNAPPDEVDQTFKDMFAYAEAQSQQFLQECMQQGTTPRLFYLASIFKLQRTDLDILLICLATNLDLKYERLFGYLQDDVTRKRPTVNLVLDLLGQPGVQRFNLWHHLMEDAPLFKYRLIEKISDQPKQSLLTHTLHVDETLVSWLLGHYAPASELGFSARLAYPQTNETDLLLTDRILGSLDVSTLSNHTLVFFGPDHARKDAAARMVAASLDHPLLSTNLEEIDRESVSLELSLKLALRDAQLNQAIPFFSGWDVLLGEDNTLPAVYLHILSEYDGIKLIAGNLQMQPHTMSDQHAFLWYNFDQPLYRQRRKVWGHFLEAYTQEPRLELDAVAGQFLLTAAQIRDAYLTARDAAAQRGERITSEDLFAAARAYSNRRLVNLAKKIEPRYGWDDIILPADQINILHEIINTVRTRPIVLEEWGVREKLASSSGVATLFAGPPGTGKTMGAEIIAHELGLDLYKIDLSTVVSKYIGETEKNISKIFEEAETSNAILFFDEADALFGKRSEVRDSHDRYANIEISYLLQRMEAYDGVTILATNLRANLDEAFTRRLQFIVDFPFPQEGDRLRIWQTLFPRQVPCEEDIDFSMLAKRYKLAGANIRNIIVSAVYLAAADGKKISMQHLLHGTHRELQKMRRLIEDDTLNVD